MAKQTILHENSHGIRIVRTDFVKRSQVRVMLPTGRSTSTYKFNLIPDVFKSPYISWANLDCCNGWAYDQDYLLRAVYEGKKLYAGISSVKSLEELPTAPHILTGKEEHDKGRELFYVCREGKLSDYYDLDEVFEHYRKLGVYLTPAVKHRVKVFCDIKISNFANRATAPFDYGWAHGSDQLICTGLLLGYPLESTAHLLPLHAKPAKEVDISR